jgi:hypothetical protein
MKTKRAIYHEEHYHKPIHIAKIIHQYTIDEIIRREQIYYNAAGDPLPWESDNTKK